MQPLVSAIITTHNRLNLLQRAIESVFGQTYPNIECVVVNDASTDGTAEYCFGRADIRFINIPREESKGGNYARNLGILAANGEYVAILDDDDYWLPTKIEKQVALIEDKKCDLVYCGTRNELVDVDGSVGYNEYLPNDNAQGDLSKYILYHIVVLTSQVLMRKQAIIDIGLFDENIRFWQEYELTIRLAQKSPFYFVNECLLVYRVNLYDNNRLTNKYKPWLDSVHYIHRKHRKLYTALSFRELIASQQLFLREGIYRANNVGNKFGARMFWFLLKLSRIDIIIQKKLHPQNS